MELKFSELLKAPLSNIHVLRELELVFNNLNISKTDSIIEIGPGNGIGSLIISKNAKKVIGIDISELSIEFLNEHVKQDNIEFCVMDATKEPSKEFLNKFDKCICVDVMEHVEDPIGLLKFISKVLKRGGLVVMTFPINNISHGRNYFTKENVYDLFTNINDLKVDIKIVRLSNFASLINNLCDRIQGILVAPMEEANRFEGHNRIF